MLLDIEVGIQQPLCRHSTDVKPCRKGQNRMLLFCEINPVLITFSCNKVYKTSLPRILFLFYSFLRGGAKMEAVFVKQQQPWSFGGQKNPESSSSPQEPVLSTVL